MAYRKDIDGLRAIAVIPVVFFHLNVPGWSGGYVGVDVFFVISGFLIAGMIAPQIAAGRFDLLVFYENRVRRILPVLAVVMLATVVAAYPIFDPDAFLDLGQSLVAATVFASNILFWKEAGYFDDAAIAKPLLHTWSLGVEEQFYALVPLGLIAAARARIGMFGAVAALTLASFFASLWMLTADPMAAFYLLPFRFWEIGLGAMLALKTPQVDLRSGPATALSLLGLAMIAGAVFAYDAATSFPGFAALLPCLGTALLIWSTGGAGRNPVRAALSWSPLVLVGLLSYSIYLWHWPIVVIYQYWVIRELGSLDILMLLIAIGAISLVSWRYIEIPFRHRPGRPSAIARAPMVGLCGVALAACVLTGLDIHRREGLPERFGEAGVRMRAEMRQDARSLCPAPERTGGTDDLLCRFGTGSTNAAVLPPVLLWGDSHAMALVPGLLEAARRDGAAFDARIRPGCPPVLGVERTDRRHYGCHLFAERVVAEAVRRPGVRTVVLAARWSAYAERSGHGPTEVHKAAKLHATTDISRGPRLSSDPLIGGLQAAISKLNQAGKRVIIVLPTPEFPYDIPSVFLRYPSGGERWLTMPYEKHLHRSGRTNETLTTVAREMSAETIDLASVICPDTCRATRASAVLYTDNDHLSSAGSRLMAPALASIFEKQGDPEPLQPQAWR